MVSPRSQQIRFGQLKGLVKEPCTITSVSPLLVTWRGQTNVPGVQASGSVYALGPALAFYQSPGAPLIIPLGDASGGGSPGVDPTARSMAAAAQTDATTALAAFNRPRTAVLLTAASGTGSFTVPEAFRLVSIAASSLTGTPRIRLYRSSADRSADASRVVGGAPPSNGSLIAEFRWTAAELVMTSGFIVSLLAGGSTVFYNVTDGVASFTLVYVRED